MKTVYLDTSAYLSVLLHESPWLRVQNYLKGKAYYTSSILFLEAHRCLIRCSREGLLSGAEFNVLHKRLEQDQNVFVIKDATLDICFNYTFPAVSLPKSLDLIHIRTALWFQENENRTLEFVTLDQNQAGGAKELGLKTVIFAD